jgi:hypothetical protein
MFGCFSKRRFIAEFMARKERNGKHSAAPRILFRKNTTVMDSLSEGFAIILTFSDFQLFRFYFINRHGKETQRRLRLRIDPVPIAQQANVRPLLSLRRLSAANG